MLELFRTARYKHSAEGAGNGLKHTGDAVQMLLCDRDQLLQLVSPCLWCRLSILIVIKEFVHFLESNSQRSKSESHKNMTLQTVGESRLSGYYWNKT